MPFPDGMGGAVYFCWPDPINQTQSWQLVGNITNAKPSAIFKINKLKGKDDNLNLTNSFMQLGQPSCVNAQVGISVEPLANIELQTPAAQTEASNEDYNKIQISGKNNCRIIALPLSATKIFSFG